MDDAGNPKQKFEFSFKTITKRKCAINEYIKPDSETKLPLLPEMVDAVTRATKDDESEESDDEDFDWYEQSPQMEQETYFCLTNMNRASLKKGEQAYNCYGNRTNRYLLIDYGFAFPDNSYDSVELYLNMSNEYKKLEIHDFVDFAPTKHANQVVRLKTDQICDMLVCYLWSCCRYRFFAKNKALIDLQP